MTTQTLKILDDPQKFLTMTLQQLGVPMPPQRVMESMVQLIEGQAETWQTPYEWLAFQKGVADTLAMLIVTGVIPHDC